MAGWVDRWMIDKQIDSQMDRQMESQIGVNTFSASDTILSFLTDVSQAV